MKDQFKYQDMDLVSFGTNDSNRILNAVLASSSSLYSYYDAGVRIKPVMQIL